MKKLKITLANTKAIEDALRAGNGRAYASTIDSAQELNQIVEEFRAAVCAACPTVKERSGATLLYRGAGASARAYSYARNVTQLSLRIGSDGRTVFLTEVQRAKAYPRQRKLFKVTLKSKSQSTGDSSANSSKLAAADVHL